MIVFGFYLYIRITILCITKYRYSYPPAPEGPVPRIKSMDAGSTKSVLSSGSSVILISSPGRLEGQKEKKKNRRFQEGCIMNVPERNNWWGYQALLSSATARSCSTRSTLNLRLYRVFIIYFSYESFPGERVEIEIRVRPRTEPCAFPNTPYGLTVTDATNLSTGVPLLPHPPILSQYYYFLFFQFFNLESFSQKTRNV